MKYVQYGKTGINISRIALGGYPFAGVNRAMNWDPYTPEGRKMAIETINTALDMGINMIDTAPGYGDGHSESIIGEVMKQRRSECFLATKTFWEGMDEGGVINCVENSLKRLNTDYVDVIQIHGGRFSFENYEYIMEKGPFHAFQKLKSQGKARWIGFTVEEPWSALDLMRSSEFDTVQVCYNLIYQSAANHLLDMARDKNMGVTVMRPMTSGIFQRLLSTLEPRWLEAADPYEICLKFVLSDSRVHAPNVGMRWPHEVIRNVEFVDSFTSAADIADLPRSTAKIYETHDHLQ